MEYERVCLGDHIGDVATHAMSVEFVMDDITKSDVVTLKLSEKEMACGTESVMCRLSEAFGDHQWKIYDIIGVPGTFDDGELVKGWTIEELCRFALAVSQMKCQDCREAFLVYVGQVGVGWKETTFDRLYLGSWLSTKHFSEEYVDTNYDMHDVPMFVRYAIDWDAVWEKLELNNSLYSVKVNSGRYVIMSADY